MAGNVFNGHFNCLGIFILFLTVSRSVVLNVPWGFPTMMNEKFCNILFDQGVFWKLGEIEKH